MSAEHFVTDFVRELKDKAADLRAYGAGDSAQTCEYVAETLEAKFRAWWLAQLTVSEAAQESGYSEERLREMAREGILPHQKGKGTRSHIGIARRDLPRRPRPSMDSRTADITERLLYPPNSKVLRR
jgi:hypothetical protein